MIVADAQYPPYEPEALIREVFLGNGVEVIDVDYAGERVALGYFENGGSAVGIERGVVLTTGRSATQGSDAGVAAANEDFAQFDNGSSVRDPNLEQIVPYLKPGGDVNIHDVARYRITFRPKGDRVSFRYVFASDEYPQFVCSEANDLFGFFISGPGIAGGFQNGAENIALIPGTVLPVSINSVNGGTAGNQGDPAFCGPPNGSLANGAFYRDNAVPGQQPVYNGLTTVLTAEASVQPCEVYTIEITIGDVEDEFFDSGVFLEAESFATSVLDVTIETPALGNELAEGCDEGRVTFRYSDLSPNPRTVNFTTAGTATSGTDYTPIPTSVTVPANASSVSLPIVALDDGEGDGSETLTFTVQLDACTSADYTVNLVDRQIVPVPPMRDTVVCPGAEVQLDATLPKTLDDRKGFVSAQQVFLFTHGVPQATDIEVTGVDPDLLVDGALTKVCVDLRHDNAADLDLYLFTPAGRALELTTDNGTGSTDGEFCFTADASIGIAEPGAPFPFAGDYLPEGAWSDIVRAADPINGTWRLQVTDDANGGIGLLRGWRLEFAARYELDYAWAPTQGLTCADCADPRATPPASTRYDVTVVDSYGCTETSDVDVDVFLPPATPAVTCSPGFDEVAFAWADDVNALRYEVSEDGGVTWVDVGTDRAYTVTGLALGASATLQVRALGQCAEATGTTTCTTQNCPTLVTTSAITPASCARYADGEIVFATSGGLAPYSYTLDSVTNVSGTFVNLAAGVYTVDIVDANNCVASASATVTEPAAVSSTTDVQPSTLCGEPFEASVSASGGGGAPYDFTWTGNQVGPTARYGNSGTYYVVIRDGRGCRSTDSVEIVIPDALTGAFAIGEVSCAGADDGRVDLSPAGGTPPYRYGLNGTFQDASAFTGLLPGVAYTATIRDARGCIRDTTFTLQEPLALAIEFTGAMVSCFGLGDGALRATVRDARGPVSFSWDGRSDTVDSIGGLTAGTYRLTVRDSAGCTATGSYDILQPGPLRASAKTGDVLCYGDATGSIQLETTGGTAPLTFSISGRAPQSDSVIVDLPAGDYSVLVTDANGCTKTASATVAEPTPLTASHQTSVITCAGETDGGIDLRVGGGRAPYTYQWVDGSTSEDRTGLSAGVYRVTVTDAGGCELDYDAELESPAELRLQPTVSDVKCFGDDNGAIALAPSGGREPYQYQWSGPNGYAFFGASPGSLVAGVYSLSLRDIYGCRIDTSFVIEEPEAITLATTVVDSVCSGASDGRAFVTVNGGTAPFDYTWDNGERGDTATALVAGTATVTVVDARGCRFAAPAEVFEVPPLSLEITQAPVLCYRDSNGVVEVTGLRYGSRLAPLTNFTYDWRGYPDSVGALITARGGAEELLVVATDARGCTATDSIVVGEPAPLRIDADLLSDVSCFGLSDGRAEALVTGGTGAYAYVWPADGTAAAINEALPVGPATVVVTDANACRDTAEVNVREPDELQATLTPTMVNCFAPNTGRISAEVVGGNVPYRYAWRHGPTVADLDSLSAGIYVVTVTDARGCTREEQAEVLTSVAVTADVDVQHATCAGETDGSIVVSASGGNGPYRYLLDQESPSRSGDFRFLAAGEYLVYAEDRNGCPSERIAVEVEEPLPVSVEAGAVIEVELGRQAEVAAAVFNAVGELTYQWMPRDSGLFACATCPETEITGAFQGVVRVDVTDERGCTGSDLLRVRVTKSVVLRVPTGFTPNADGQDDRLLVHGTSGTRIERFEVFNRWGQLVYAAGDFLANDEGVGWDGTYLGTYAPTGTYVYRVSAIFPDGSLENVSGQTTLIR